MVPIALKDGPDLFQAVQTRTIGDAASGINPLGRVLLVEIQQPQADLVSLFRVLAALQLGRNPNQGVRSDLLRPAFQAPGCPLLLCPVAFGHMGGIGGKPRCMLTRMGGYQLPPEVDLHQVVAGMDFQMLTDVLVRHRVVVVLVADMVVNVDFDRLDCDVAVRVCG